MTADTRTPFEREIDEASSLANIVDVVKPVSYSPPVETISALNRKTIGPCRYSDDLEQREQHAIRDGGRSW